MKLSSQPTQDFEIYEGGPFKADSIGEIERQLEEIVGKYCHTISPYGKGYNIIRKSKYADFGIYIKNLLNGFFRNGLKNGKIETTSKHDFEYNFCNPSNTSLSEIDEAKIVGAIGIILKTELIPRYLKDGDIGEYYFKFEILISKEVGNLQDYFIIHIRTIKKSDLSTTQRDASIKSAHDAHRKSLMRILQGGAPGLGQR